MDNENVNNTNEDIGVYLNRLAHSFTIAQRNVKILHWNYNDIDFTSVHPWLDTVADQYGEFIDLIYERLRMFNLPLQATMNETISDCPIEAVNSAYKYSNKLTFALLLKDINTLRVLADGVASISEQNKWFTCHDEMVKISAALDKLRYFVASSIQQQGQAHE